MPKATVVISADNQLKKGLDPAKQTMLQFQKIASDMEKKLSKAFTITGVATVAVKSIKAVTNSAKECIQAFAEAEKVSKRLEAVWNNVGAATNKSAKEVDALAEALEKETYFSSESIKEAELLLAATESLTSDGFERALNVSLDLAAALGEDVTSAAQTLAKAIQEPETALSRLKSIGVSFTEDEKKQIKELAAANKEYEAQNIILSKIESKYKDVAKAINNTPAGKLDAIRDVLGDIRESFGQGLLDAISPVLDTIYASLVRISNWIAENSDSTVAEIKTKIYDAAKNGTTVDLSGYTTQALLKAVESANYDAKATNEDRSSWLRAFGFGSEGIGIMADYINKNVMTAVSMELRDRGYNSFTDAERGALTVNGATSTGTAVVVKSAIEEFFDSYMPEDTFTKYSNIISTAQTYLDKFTQAVPTSRDELVRLLGLPEDSTGADVNKAIEDNGYVSMLKTVISTYSAKLDALTKGIVDSPTLTDLDSILKEYGKESKDYQIKQLKEEYNRIAAAYEYASEEDRVYLRQILDSNEKQRKELEGISDEVTSGSFLDAITDRLASVFKYIGFGDEQSSTAAGTVIGTFTQNLGEAGEVIERLATNMASMGAVLGAIVTALQYVAEGLAETLKPILNDFMKDGIEPLRELGRVIGDILLPILEDLMPLVEQSARFLTGIFNTLGLVLKPIVSFISTLLTPIIMRLTMVLETLQPILEAISGAVLLVSTVFEWVGSWIKHIFAVIFNALASINIMGWRPLSGLHVDDDGTPASIEDMYLENLKKMHMGYEYSPVESASMNQALSAAQYRGATSVTINIYAEAPIVGEGGMREFARMIRDEFDALNYYGVTT